MTTLYALSERPPMRSPWWHPTWRGLDWRKIRRAIAENLDVLPDHYDYGPSGCADRVRRGRRFDDALKTCDRLEEIVQDMS